MTAPARHRRALPEDDEPRRSPARRLGHALSEVAQTLLALGGLVAIVLVILAFTMHITLIMFKTGSMSPTIPQGSVAVVQRVPASSVQVGDVVTVDRPGELPITHRIVAIEMPDDSAGTPDPEARLLTLRGDANADNDPAPYLVTSVRIVLWSFPGAARFVVWSSQPQVLAAVTLVASALVTWAFWPRTPRRRDDVADEPTGGPADDDTDPQVTASDQDERPTDGPQVSRP